MEKDEWGDVIWNEQMAKRAIKKAFGENLHAEGACWTFIGDSERAEFRFRKEGVSMSWANGKHTFLEYADIIDLFGYEAEDVADEEGNPSSPRRGRKIGGE